MTPTTFAQPIAIAPEIAASAGTSRRSRQRWAHVGPRCPQCAGPLVFGEGCSLCPVCGHSSCAV